MIDDKRVYRESVTSASLDDGRLQWSYHATLQAVQLAPQRRVPVNRAMKCDAVSAPARGAPASRRAVIEILTADGWTNRRSIFAVVTPRSPPL